MFCCTLLYVHCSTAIILMGKRELVALLNLSYWCLVMVERLFLAVPWGCLRFVIVVFPDHTHLLLLIQKTFYSFLLFLYIFLGLWSVFLVFQVILLIFVIQNHWRLSLLLWIWRLSIVHTVSEYIFFWSWGLFLICSTVAMSFLTIWHFVECSISSKENISSKDKCSNAILVNLSNFGQWFLFRTILEI